MQDWDMVIHNVHLATMEHGYGELLDAAIAVQDGRIAWFGPGDELPASGAVLFDARPDRLPYAHRPRGQPQRRIRGAPEWRQL
jgi:hypothetical protein